MTGAALLDTSALISVMDSRSISELPYERVIVSSLTYAELRLSLATAKDVSILRQRARRIEEIERKFGVGVPFDDECARAYERICETAIGLGKRARSNTLDRMIAAVSIVHGLPLVTANAADLRGLESMIEIVSLRSS